MLTGLGPAGLSMILPPPLESGLEVETSTVKRNPKQKLTTFKSPEAQIMGPPSPPNSPNSSGISINSESGHLHGQKIGSL